MEDENYLDKDSLRADPMLATSKKEHFSLEYPTDDSLDGLWK